MEKIKNKLLSALGLASRPCLRRAFCNIAEGTHAGSVTMVAGENIESPNLLVKAGEAENLVVVASAEDAPIGVCGDEGAKGETVGVYLPGSAESTFICVAASSVNMGDSLYTAAGGKVSTVAADGCRKVGVALCSAAAGGAEKTVKAEASEGNIAFTLDVSGTAETTKISWIAIRKN